jgi:hypothetical protein
LTEDPITLTAKAAKVLADCETFLEIAAESVRTLPAERKEASERRTSAEEQYQQAVEQYNRAWKDSRRLRGDDLGKRQEDIAKEEYLRARNQLDRATSFLASDYLDTEYRKAVARQIAGLLHEDFLQELGEIATRSDDPELQRTVEECKVGVNRVTHYVIKMFPGRNFPLNEVRKARTEARKILDRLKNPPVD